MMHIEPCLQNSCRSLQRWCAASWWRCRRRRPAVREPWMIDSVALRGVGGCLTRQRGVSNLHRMNKRQPISSLTAKTIRWLFKCYASFRCLKPSLCWGRLVARKLVACCTSQASAMHRAFPPSSGLLCAFQIWPMLPNPRTPPGTAESWLLVLRPDAL
jgi:hypothetical protein